jgi:hypothetical protein
MKRFLTLALIGALALGVSSVVFANVCAFDPVPAASLLFPFVAYDYDAGFAGDTTIFSITNVSAEAQIVHVTVWTDFSIAILDFNILLSGYDVQRINIRDILADGQLPITVIQTHAQNPSDPNPVTGEPTTEGIFPDGPVSPQNTINGGWVGSPAFALDPPKATSDLDDDRCNDGMSAYPGRYTQKIDASTLALFKSWLQSSQTGAWFHSDDCFKSFDSPYVLSGTLIDPWMYVRDTTDPTWMYITADVVQTCNKTFPDDPGYWTLPANGGEARYENVLIGDMTWLNNNDRFSEMNNAVHLEADVDLRQVATIAPNGFPISFYARYSNPDGVSDFREPLPTAWAFRYQGAGQDGLDTLIRAWKGGTEERLIYDLEIDPEDQSPDTFIASNCNAYTYYSWDENEDVLTTTSVPWSQPGGASVVPNLLPLETQEVSIDQFDFVDHFGWMMFVWPASNYDTWQNVNFPDFYQTWMGAKYVKTGDYSAAVSGAVMANFNCFSDQVIPNLGINYNYVGVGGYVTSPSIFE